MAAKKEVTFVIRARDLTRGVFRRIRRGITSMRTALVGLAAAVGLGKVVKDLLNFATGITAASKRLNISTDALQALKLEAEGLQVPFESLLTILQRIQSNAGAAINGQEELGEAFRFFGISIDELANSDALGLYLKLSDGVKRVGTESFRARDRLRRITDTEGLKAIELLARGSGQFAENLERLRGTGAIQTAEQLRVQAEAEQAAREASARAMAAAAQVLADNLPQLTEAMVKLASLLEQLPQIGAFAQQLPQQLTSDVTRGVEPVVRGLSDALTPEVLRRGLEALEETARNTEDFGELS